MGVDFKFENCFRKFRPWNAFLGKFDSKTSKCFVLNETRYKALFKGAFEFHNYFM